MRTYLVATMTLGAWIALDDGAPLWEVVASSLMGPVVAPVAVAFNLYCLAFER